MFTRSVSPETAPDKPTYIEIGFENGDPVSLNGAPMSPATILEALNKVSFFFPTLSFPLLFQKKLKTKKKKLKKKKTRSRATTASGASTSSSRASSG